MTLPLFQAGETTPRDKAKISKAQREIDTTNEWTDNSKEWVHSSAAFIQWLPYYILQQLHLVIKTLVGWLETYAFNQSLLHSTLLYTTSILWHFT